MAQLKVALLSYRSNPYSGGQGIYIAHLSKALCELGHEVTVFSGPPYPDLDLRVNLVKVSSLDLYSKDNKFSDISMRELINPLNFFEWLSINSGGFAEPYTFGKRLKKILKRKLSEFDVIHDNQSLCYELLYFQKKIPLVTTIHHPISKDLKYELQSIVSEMIGRAASELVAGLNLATPQFNLRPLASMTIGFAQLSLRHCKPVSRRMVAS